MRIPWRFLGWLLALATVAVAFFIIRSGLQQDQLAAAVQREDVDAARRILEQQPDLINAKLMPQGSSRSSGGRLIRWTGWLLIHDAIGTIGVGGASVQMVEMLVAHGANLGTRLHGDTLLHLASENGEVAVMRWLLDNGADVNARNGCEHPVDALCTSGRFADMQPERPAEARESCPGCAQEGRTPLHAAQRLRADEAASLLLSRGAEVRAVDAAGRTPLHTAALLRNGEVARVLCAAGADPTQRDRAGQTPEDVARAADLQGPGDNYTSTGPGEVAGWLRPGGGCAQVAARGRANAPVPEDDVAEVWRAYICKERDPSSCGKP